MDVWQVKKAFYALLDNGIRAALVWDGSQQSVVGMAHRHFLHSLHVSLESLLLYLRVLCMQLMLYVKLNIISFYVEY